MPITSTALDPHAKGNLESVEAHQNMIVASGWTASASFDAPDSFVVSVGGEPMAIDRVEKCLSSIDVSWVWPGLRGVDACRFRLWIKVDPEARELRRDALVLVTPFYGDMRGPVLKQVLRPSIPHPPAELAKIVGNGFHEASLEFLEYFTSLAGLRPADDVLDIGCGLGRMAYGLTQYLAPQSRYEGFDIIPELIAWANDNITSNYPNFCFTHVPLFNSFYYPSGTLNAVDFRFPYADGAFDFFFLTSVFTHVPGPVVKNYLREIGRVARPGARGMVTAFVLDPESRALIASGKSSLPLVHEHTEGWVVQRSDPDYAIGFDRESLDAWFGHAGLRIVDVKPGSWCGREKHLTYQDLLIVQKT